MACGMRRRGALSPRSDSAKGDGSFAGIEHDRPRIMPRPIVDAAGRALDDEHKPSPTSTRRVRVTSMLAFTPLASGCPSLFTDHVQIILL